MSMKEVLEKYDKVRKALDELYWSIDRLGRSREEKQPEPQAQEEPTLEEVTVKLPRQAVEYVAALCKFSGEDPAHFWTHEVTSTIEALVDDYGRPYTEKGWIMERYGLSKVFDP